MKYTFLLLVILATFITSNLYAVSIPIYIDASQSIIVTQSAPEFKIQLKSNPTTGYSWIIQKYDQQLLTLINYHFMLPSTKLIGAGGIAEWDFKATAKAFNAPQKTKIQLLYARSWDVKDHPTNVAFSIIFKK